MKLLHSPASPYVRKVMIVAHEMGLTDKLELVTGSGSPLAPNPETVAMNPLGRIPALTLDDGTLLSDSRVICRYFNHLGGGALYSSGADEFPIIAREALAEGIIDSALLIVYEGRLRPEELQFQAYIDGQMGKIERGMAAFNTRINEMSGDVTIDKLVLGTACGYLNFRMPDMGWQGRYPDLAAWFAEFEQRPSIQATMPVG